MTSMINTLIMEHKLLDARYSLVLDMLFNVYWQSDDMQKLGIINDNNKINFEKVDDQLWTYFLLQLQLEKKSNLLLPITEGSQQSIYHVAGIFDEQRQVFVLQLKLISKSIIKNREQMPPLLNYFRQGIIVTTINHSIVHFNQNAEKMIPKQFLQRGLCMKDLFLRKIIEVQEEERLQEACRKKDMFRGSCSIVGNNFSINCIFHESDQHYVYMFDESSVTEQLNVLNEQQYLTEIGKMASTLVHEMRNPMTCIKGYVDIMLMEQKTNTDYMKIIEKELSHLTQLCGDILFLSKPIEKNAKGVDLLQIVQEVAQLMELEVKEKNIDFRITFNEHSTFIVAGNDMYFKQVILNLVKNAVQATNEKGVVEIVLIEKIHSVELIVKDTGCGIEKQQLENIFDMFFTTKEYGTGLGLPVVKKIIDQLNGTISVKSTVNIGTNFTINIPTIH